LTGRRRGNKGIVDIRRVIHRRIRHESPGTSVAADVNAVVAINVGAGTHPKTNQDREASMKKSEERRAGGAPPEERVEEVGQDTSGRAAPIDEDVAGELNAALPEEENDGKGGGPERAA
jgi:hypothetical protein